MASKDWVDDGSKNVLGNRQRGDVETWTSRQIGYLHRRRLSFKGAVTKIPKKSKDIISKDGSRTVLRFVKERVFQVLQDASKTTQDNDVNRRSSRIIRIIVRQFTEWSGRHCRLYCGVFRKMCRWTVISHRIIFLGRRSRKWSWQQGKSEFWWFASSQLKTKVRRIVVEICTVQRE